MSSGTATIRIVKHLQNPIVPDALMEAPMDEVSHATWGVIQGLSLPSLLQMLNMERKTCTIRVSSGRRVGFFYVREGQIINACYRGFDGLDAVQALIAAPVPKMEMDGQLHDPTQRIDLRLEEILMHTAQLQDEQAMAASSGPVNGPSEEADTIPVSEIGKWQEVAPQQARPQVVTKPSHPVGLALGSALVLVMAATGWLLFPRSVEIGILSTPAGASVSVDGVPQGVTPLRLKRPSPLRGTLTVSQPGYQPYQHVFQAEDRSLAISLQPLPVAAPVEASVSKASALPTPVKELRLNASVKAKPRQDEAPHSKKDIFDQLRKPQE